MDKKDRSKENEKSAGKACIERKRPEILEREVPVIKESGIPVLKQRKKSQRKDRKSEKKRVSGGGDDSEGSYKSFRD